MKDRPGVSSNFLQIIQGILDRLHTVESAVGNRATALATDTAPVLTALTSNPVLGAGSVASAEATDDGWIRGNGLIKFGTSGVSAGNGLYLISLPAQPAPLFAGASNRVIGEGFAFHTGNIIDLFNLVWSPARGANTELWSTKSPGNPAYTSTNPWTWVAGDYILYTLLYPRV